MDFFELVLELGVPLFSDGFVCQFDGQSLMFAEQMLGMGTAGLKYLADTEIKVERAVLGQHANPKTLFSRDDAGIWVIEAGQNFHQR